MLLGRRAECLAITRLLEAARSGTSGVLVVRGAAGLGKSAQLDFARESAFGFCLARAIGVESEMELAFAGLHQLCAPLFDGLARLPAPQRGALEVAFGLSEGPRPDVFLVGLAVLGLLADAAREQPLLCVLDDVQWLDRASAQAVALAARRLEAEPVAVLCALREPSERGEFDGLPALQLEGLSETDAMELLASEVKGRIDEQVAARIVAEAEGNPLALLELPRTRGPADHAGGFALASAPLATRIEASFRQRAEQLPPDTQRFLLLAAAEPVGDPTVLWQAASILGITDDAAGPAEDDGLLEVGALVRFRHPLVRSAVYRASSASRRRVVHAALAEATDLELDPDRRAWHRAQAARGLDEAVAEELESSASRAQARGGLAAAAAFLERSAMLTGEPARRADRALDAAQAKHDAGAFSVALELVALAEAGPLDELQRARAERIRARVAIVEQRGSDAVRLLLAAAGRLESLDQALSRATYLEAFWAANDAGGRDDLQAVVNAMSGRPPSDGPGATELLLTGWARLFTEGFPAGTDLLKRAMQAFRDETSSSESDLQGLSFACRIAFSLWDDESWDELTSRWVSLARAAGALIALPRALWARSDVQCRRGDLAGAAATLQEAQGITDATGTARETSDLEIVILGAEEEVASAAVEAALQDGVERGDEMRILEAEFATATLHNSLGRYESALAAAQRYCARHPLKGIGFVFIELIEAASRCDEPEVAREVLQRLSERTKLGGTDFALGIEARSRALTSEGEAAEACYREAIERLGRTRMRLYHARNHLVYGEWLRRQNRRVDARHQLQAAYEMLDAMGATSFAKRARAELLATGGPSPGPSRRLAVELTPQEALVARLASDGLTNNEIAAQLFLSPYTVDYHLRKVFRKLDINGRGQLDRSLLDRVSSLGAR